MNKHSKGNWIKNNSITKTEKTNNLNKKQPKRFSENKYMSKVAKSKILFEDIPRNLNCKIKENSRVHLKDYFF